MKILLTHFYPKLDIGGLQTFVHHFQTMMSGVAQVDLLCGPKLDKLKTAQDWRGTARNYDLLLLAHPGHPSETYYQIMPSDLPWVAMVHNPERNLWSKMYPGLKWVMENSHIIFLRKSLRDSIVPKYNISKFCTVLNLPFDAHYLDPDDLLSRKRKPPIVLCPNRFTVMKNTKLVLEITSDIEARVVFAAKFARSRKNGSLRPDDIRVIPLWSLIKQAQNQGATFLNGYDRQTLASVFGVASISVDMTSQPGGEGSAQYVTLEAMQYGAVPVMFRVWEDIMLAGRNFEPIDEPENLVPTVNKLLKEPEQLEEYIFTNMEFINKHYSYQVLAPQYMAFFEEVLKC